MGADSRRRFSADLPRHLTEGGHVDRPVERRLDERAAGRSETLTAFRVLDEIVDRVAKLDRVVSN